MDAWEIVIHLMIYLIKYVFPKEDLNLCSSVFSVITWINESKILSKNILCKCKCKFDGRNKNWTKRGIMINVDVSAKMYEHNNAYEEDYI